MNLPKAIIVELDGVLSDDSKRRHFISDRGDYDKKQDANLIRKIMGDWKPDWNAYHAAGGEDGVNEAILELCYRFSQEVLRDLGRSIIFLTSRPEKYTRQTNQWLSKRCCFGWDLFMRPDFLPEMSWVTHPHPSVIPQKQMVMQPDNRPSFIVKEEIYRAEIEGKYEVLFVLDKGEDAKMWKELGLTVLEVL